MSDVQFFKNRVLSNVNIDVRLLKWYSEKGESNG